MINMNAIKLVKLECPLCNTVNEYETISANSYKVAEFDSDFCPRNTLWNDIKYQHINPLAYFSASCQNCHYTCELTPDFLHWKSRANSNIITESIKNKHLVHLAEDESVVRSLGEQIDIRHCPFESSVIKLHLTVFDELLKDEPSLYDLGRFYLKLGWLYRTCDEFTATPKNSSIEIFENNKKEVTEMLDQMESKFKKLHLSFEKIINGKDIPSEAVHDSELLKEDFETYRSELLDNYTTIKKNLKKYNDLKDGLVSLINPAVARNGFAVSNGCCDFESFLADINKNWSYVVINEKEALKKAVDYFVEYVEGEHAPQNENRLLRVYYLIADLSGRIGEVDLTNKYSTRTIELGQEMINLCGKDKSRSAFARKILELVTVRKEVLLID